jgi:hypothetical protein
MLDLICNRVSISTAAVVRCDDLCLVRVINHARTILETAENCEKLTAFRPLEASESSANQR